MHDFNEIAIFAKVAQELSFTRAAQNLGIPKSTVSERVARLEARLGVRLLERTTRSLRLTPSGEAYHARVLRILKDLDEADTEIVASHHLPTGTLRLASPLVFAQLFLDDVVHEYLIRHPNVVVDMVVEDRPFDVIAENLDLAVHVVGPIDAHLVARKLGAVERWCVAAPSFLEGKTLPTDPLGLAGHDCIVGGFHRGTRWTFHRGDATVAVDVRARLGITSLELAHRAAVRGGGITISPSALCLEDVAAGRLVRLLADWTPEERTVSIVYPSQRHLAARVRSFIDLVVERWGDFKDLARSGLGGSETAERLRQLVR